MLDIFSPAGMTNFDSSAYLGQWYEYSNMFEIYQDIFAGSSEQTPIIYHQNSFTFYSEKNLLPGDKAGLHKIIVNLHISFSVGAKCVRATYTEEGDIVGVKNEYVSPL